AVILLWLPWLPSFIAQAHHSAIEGRRGSALNPITLSTIGETMGRSLFGDPFIPLHRLPGTGPMLVLGALLVVALPFGFLRRRGSGAWRPALAMPWMLILLLAVAPMILILLYSL